MIERIQLLGTVHFEYETKRRQDSVFVHAGLVLIMNANNSFYNMFVYGTVVLLWSHTVKLPCLTRIAKNDNEI